MQALANVDPTGRLHSVEAGTQVGEWLLRRPSALVHEALRCLGQCEVCHLLWGGNVLIGRVLGSVVSTAKDSGLNGHRLQLVETTDTKGTAIKNGSKRNIFVAVDGAGAGTDELVLVAIGSAARHGHGAAGKPIDALIVGVIDSVDIQGTDVFRKS